MVGRRRDRHLDEDSFPNETRKGVTGITSNPKIFHEAITGSDVYDDAIEALDDRLTAEQVYEHLALDPEMTVREAHRLWQAIDRPNVFIKIPGTVPGVEAIRQCLEDGINVNVTLLFSVDRYRDVAEAYTEAVDLRGDQAGACAASFFLGRIDTMVDARIDDLIEKTPGMPAAVVELRGKTALALARKAYAHWRDTFGPRFASPRDSRPLHKLVWASTSRSKSRAFVSSKSPTTRPPALSASASECAPSAAAPHHGPSRRGPARSRFLRSTEPAVNAVAAPPSEHDGCSRSTRRGYASIPGPRENPWSSHC